MGNAVLDVIFKGDENLFKNSGLVKGQMTIVDQSQSEKTTENLSPIKKSSGGSVANTMAGIGILGGKAAFCGRVFNDNLGRDFINDISKSNVKYLCDLATDGPPTAKCSVFVTEDGERTMQTFLGASVLLNENDIKEEFFTNTSILFIEGYLWSSDTAREAIKKAIKFAEKRNITTVFSLSDAGLTKMFRKSFEDFIKMHVDILVGNSNEFSSLFKESDLNAISKKASLIVNNSVMTCGENGAVFFKNGNLKKFGAYFNDNIVDTTGAGDMFASGFLYKLNLDEKIEDCIDFGSKVASRVLSQYGGRLDEFN